MPLTSTPSREARPATAPSIAIRWSPWESIAPPRRPPAPSIDHPVLGRLDPAAERVQGVGHRRDPVGLLAAQLGGVADRRRPLGEAGGEGDQRQLVDRQRHLGAADLGAAQLGGEHPEVADRLAALARPPAIDLDLGPHPLEDRQQAGPGRVEPDAARATTSLPATSSAGDDEEGGRGEVGGDDDLARLEPLGRPRSPRSPPSRSTVGPGGGQHPLAVVAGRQRLDHASLALGQQAGEEQAGLDLGAGDRQLVLDAAQRRSLISSGGSRSSRQLSSAPICRSGTTIAVDRPARGSSRRRRASSARRPARRASPAADAAGCRRCRRRSRPAAGRAGRRRGSRIVGSMPAAPTPSTRAPSASTAARVERVSAASR